MNYWNIHFVFNLAEGFWWIGLGVWVLCSKLSFNLRYKVLLSIILILFGISDFVEMATGSWWQPWWLGIWKGLCVGIGLILFIHFFKERRLR